VTSDQASVVAAFVFVMGLLVCFAIVFAVLVAVRRGLAWLVRLVCRATVRRSSVPTSPEGVPRA
jgi:hypothetical protein